MVIHMSDDAPEPCRVVALEWDRSHEGFIAVVRAESASGVIVSQVHDLSILGGLRWIRADEVVSMEDVPNDSPVVRLADHRGARTMRVDASLTELVSLLDLLTGLATPIAVYCERTGSAELLVGSKALVDSGRLVLSEVDPSGTHTGATLGYDLDEIISVEWGTTYLDDLAELASLPAEGPGNIASPG